MPIPLNPCLIFDMTQSCSFLIFFSESFISALFLGPQSILFTVYKWHRAPSDYFLTGSSNGTPTSRTYSGQGFCFPRIFVKSVYLLVNVMIEHSLKESNPCFKEHIQMRNGKWSEPQPTRPSLGRILEEKATHTSQKNVVLSFFLSL